MSYCQLKAIPETGDIYSVQEFKNSWGFAARVWSDFAVRYLGWKESGWLGGNGQAVWDCWKREDVPEHQKAVMLSTFDRAVIEWEHRHRMADYYRAYVEDFPADGKVDHIPKIAASIDGLKSDKPMFGLCFYVMSVAEDLWWVHDEGEEDGRPYDISRDEGHFCVFASLADIKTAVNR